MRKLNKKQKKMIDNWFNNNWTGQGSIYTIEQMLTENLDNIMNINIHEDFYNNAERYLSDKISDILYQK